MPNLNVIVVEDEAIVRRDIARTLTSLGHRVSAECASGEEATEACRIEPPHVVLMDIRLRSGGSGIDAARAIMREFDVPVVFLTANTDPETVTQARNVAPYGFIAKPFRSVDLQAAVEMAVHHHAEDRRVRDERDRLRAAVGDRKQRTSLFVRVKGRLVGLRYHDIQYVEALKDYVGIHLKDKRVVVLSKLGDMESVLPSGDFLRVHRSYIVRIDRIKAIEGMDLIMEKNDQVIPIGGHYLAQVRERLGIDRE